MDERRPVYPTHPGEVLAGELQELGVTAAQLARELHVPPARLYRLIAGQRAMTVDTALRLERWLGVEAAFWMNLQQRYELDVARDRLTAEIERVVRPLHTRTPGSSAAAD